MPAYRVTADQQRLALAVVGLHDGAHRPAALIGGQATRRGAAAAFEFMADHAAAAADRAFLRQAAPGRLLRLAHVLGLDVKAVDVVEQAVEGFHHHRHIPIHRVVACGQRFTLQRDQRIAHHAHAVGVGEGDRAGQQARFAHPFQAGGVTVAVQHVHAGKAGAWRAEPGRGSITVTPVRTLRPSAKSA